MLRRASVAAVLVSTAFVLPGARAPRAAAPTFNRDVLPILQKNCQICHRPGEVAPMSLLTYSDARPWARAMKTAVAARTMPPWFADPTYGHFKNARRLSDAEIDTVAQWADNGAPEGDAADRPAPLEFHEGWNIKPDIVVEMPNEVALPAAGPIDYQYVIVKGDFKEDLWARAAEVRPGNRAAVHHLRVYVRPPGSGWLKGAPYGVPFSTKDYEKMIRAEEPNRPGARSPETFVKWNPGLNEQVFEIDGAGKFIPKGSDVVFSIHYNAIGKPTTDRSKVGISLASGAPPRRYLVTDVLNNYNFTIAPGDPDAVVRQEVTLQNDARLVWLQPHMHARGKAYEYSVVYPTGETEVLLKTKFDFNWQIGYELVKPVLLPKGSTIVGIAHFDNSPANRSNPDPTVAVHFGQQTWDEMPTGFVGLVFDADVDPATLFRVPSYMGKSRGIPLD
jgi:hypothetical protein